MDIPSYLRTGSLAIQEIYQENLNQALTESLSNNGWIVPSIDYDSLAVKTVLNQSNGRFDTLANIMPDGTLWFVTNPPTGDSCYVGKIDGNLVKFTTTAFP